MPWPERRRLPLVAAGVLLLHAALLLVLLQAGVWRERQPARGEPPPLLLRWVTSPPAPTAAPAQPGARLPQPPRVLPPAVPLLQVPSAAALPAAPDTAPAETAPAAPEVQRPLVLDLPPAAARRASQPEWRRNPALDDARANGAGRGGIEARIAAVTGDGRWSVEQLPDGRRRYRRGDECRIVQPARSAQLEPFNASVYTPPPAAGNC